MILVYSINDHMNVYLADADKWWWMGPVYFFSRTFCEGQTIEISSIGQRLSIYFSNHSSQIYASNSVSKPTVALCLVLCVVALTKMPYWLKLEDNCTSLYRFETALEMKAAEGEQSMLYRGDMLR